VWLLLSDWCNFGGIPLAVEIPCSWVELASGAPDSRYPHFAKAQGVGAGPDTWGKKTAMWAFPHKAKVLYEYLITPVKLMGLALFLLACVRTFQEGLQCFWLRTHVYNSSYKLVSLPKMK
jgi:hypothetical protein